ncbi:HIT family protein [Alcanivorax sp.]|uniref:HIT family protein n=1 Tax=Alcanivorax TaxID=59753 RepID=UPI0019C6D2A1|nr:HIT family protein [Alcanivorax sp.]MBD3643926.1 HIT family protein [Alcanivorax sp.]
MSECIFCQIRDGKLPASVVYEDERAMVILDLFPIREAHCLVIPKEHAPLLEQLDGSLSNHLMDLARRTIMAQKRAGLAVKAHNIVVNDGREANQHVPHVHVHVIPRRGGDTLVTAFTWATRLLNIFGLARRRKRLDRLAGLLAEHFPEAAK